MASDTRAAPVQASVGVDAVQIKHEQGHGQACRLTRRWLYDLTFAALLAVFWLVCVTPLVVE
jgi:hypothetical protein